MLNLDDLLEDDGKDKRTSKERRKEEKALEAQRVLEEKKYNLRKDKLDKELQYEGSCHDLVRNTYDTLGYRLKWPLVKANSRHQRGTFELLVELSDRRIRLLEDTVKGRDLRRDLLKIMHVEVINTIIKKHENNINTLTEDFLKTKEKVMANRKTFLQTALVKGKQLRDEIRVASYASDKGEIIQKLIQRHESDLANYNEMCLRRFEEFYKDYEKRILDKWIVFKNIFEDYKKKSKVLRRDIYIARDKDNKENKEIIKLKKMRMKFEAQFEATKTIINPGMERNLVDMGKKVEARESCLKSLQQIQKRVLAEDDRKLDHLNRVTDKVMKELREVKTLAEKVVRLRRACSPLETEAELVNVTDLRPEELDHLDYGYPAADVLELQVSRAQAQNLFMEGKMRNLKAERDRLKNCLRNTLLALPSLEDKAALAGGLHQLQ